jgi:glycerol uptake facilitator-like aquaporin
MFEIISDYLLVEIACAACLFCIIFSLTDTTPNDKMRKGVPGFITIILIAAICIYNNVI